MADDLPMEAMDDMPELIDVDVPDVLPSLIEQNSLTGTDADEFKVVCVTVDLSFNLNYHSLLRSTENARESPREMLRWRICLKVKQLNQKLLTLDLPKASGRRAKREKFAR